MFAYHLARASPNPQIWWVAGQRLGFYKALCQAAMHLTLAIATEPMSNDNLAHLNSRMVLQISICFERKLALCGISPNQ